jgi:hypothetical protein
MNFFFRVLAGICLASKEVGVRERVTINSKENILINKG